MMGFGVALCAFAVFVAMAAETAWAFMTSLVILLLGLGLIVFFESCLVDRTDLLEKRLKKLEKKFKDSGLDFEGDIYD